MPQFLDLLTMRKWAMFYITNPWAGFIGSADTSNHPVKLFSGNGHLLVKSSGPVMYGEKKLL